MSVLQGSPPFPYPLFQARKPTGENDLKIQNIEQLGGWLPLVQGPAWGVSDPEGSSGEQPCSADVHDEHSGEMVPVVSLSCLFAFIPAAC